MLLRSPFVPAVVSLLLLTTSSLPARADDDGIRVWTEPVAGSEIPWAIVEGVIDAPPDAVWAIVSRCNDYGKNMPRVAAARELSRSGDEATSFTTTCEVTADLPFPLPDLTSVNKAQHTIEPGKRYVRQWSLVRGDYSLNEGSWTLVAVDDGKKTKTTYRLRVRPNVPLPDGLLSQAQRNTMPDMIRNLRNKTKR
jgi:ribosome-associated toxin RatA of RatAB toxin-antitoxin module